MTLLLSADLETFRASRDKIQTEQVRNNSIRMNLTEWIWFLCGIHADKTLPTDWTGTCTFGVTVPSIHIIQPHVSAKLTRSIVPHIEYNLGNTTGRSLFPSVGVGFSHVDLNRPANWTEAILMPL